MTLTIDAHHHYWQGALQEQAWRTPAHERIARDYEPEHLAGELDRTGIDSTVLVQSVDSPAENDRLANYASTPSVAGVVGWLPLQDPAAARAELKRADTGAWCGVRCLVGRDDLDWLALPETLALFGELADRRLSWDIVPVTRAQVRSVVSLARAVPQLRIVVDHLARPPIDSGGWEPWASQLADLARCPNIALKVSVGIDVLTAWAAWEPEKLTPYVRRAMECFGLDRLMLASNWPVIELRTDYGRSMDDLLRTVIDNGASAADLTAIRGGTACRWYALRINEEAHA